MTHDQPKDFIDAQSPALPEFRVGEIYRRQEDINIPFGGNRQSGISYSARTPAVFLFSGASGESYGYRDYFDDDGNFHYSGEGTQGSMQFTKGNLAILEHSATGRALHVFKTLGKGKGQKYIGEYVYQGHEIQRLPDSKKELRDAIIFRLVPVERLALRELTPFRSERAVLTLEEARANAIASAKPSGAVNTTVRSHTVYERSDDVRTYVLMRAQGTCELCNQPAPFYREDNSPYLEPHHTTRVSDGGPDHPRHVAALCPNCHREVHYGQQGKIKNAELQVKLAALEPE